MQQDTTWVYVALGSNIGDGVAQLQQAVQLLQPLAVGQIRCSSLWKTEPVAMPDADWFTNAVVGFDTRLDALDLLKALQQIESDSGRVADPVRNTPRTLDLDIVSYGDETLVDDRLQLPHPRAHNRLFVLMPLAELAPQFQFPGDGRTIAELVQQAPSLLVEKLHKSL